MTQKSYGTVATNRLEVLESPLSLLPGQEPVFTINIAGTGTLSAPTMKLFKGSKDVSADCLTGSMSISGRAITCKQIYNLTPGEWAFYVYYTDGNVPDERFCRFTVMKEQA